MKRSLLASLIVGSLASPLALAQVDTNNSAYVISATAKKENNVVRSGTYGAEKGKIDTLCWRTGYWTPAAAIAECDPGLTKAPEAPKVEAPTPPAKTETKAAEPAASPAAAAPAPTAVAPTPTTEPAPTAKIAKLSLSSKALFDFDKSTLKPEGKKALDTEVIAKLKQLQKLELVLVTGHTDMIGSEAYNQKLSERRAATVKNYLASQGIAADKIEMLGLGKTQPVAGVVCNQKERKALIACMQPHRRVEVEVKGDAAADKK